MSLIKCLIVDDEPFALKVLGQYIEKTPFLTLSSQCNSALDAIETLEQNAIDVIFLDINMPELSGIDFVKTFDQLPYIIFTTAYPEYALEGFEVEAVDYLLKPFSFERFLKAAQRVKHLVETNQSVADSIFLKADKKLHNIRFEQIRYLEAYGDYVKVHMQDRMLLTKERLAKIEEQLPSDQFVRTHRSYIISRHAIDYIEGNHVRIGENLIPVSQTYRKNLVG